MYISGNFLRNKLTISFKDEQNPAKEIREMHKLFTERFSGHPNEGSNVILEPGKIYVGSLGSSYFSAPCPGGIGSESRGLKFDLYIVL